MNKTPYSFLIVILLVLVTSHTANCQTVYSLFDLSRLANEHSENIKIAGEDVEIAVQEKSRARSVLIPRATAFGAATHYKDADQMAPNSLTMGVKLTQSFTLNGKELIAYDVTKRSIESKEFAMETVRSQYLLQVSQAYYNILSAQRFLEIAQSDVKRLETHRAAVQEKLNVGNVTKTDLYRAEAELSKARTEKVIAENRVFRAKAALRNLVEVEKEFDLEKGTISDIETYDAALEDIQANALKNRSEIKDAMKQVYIAQRTITFEESDFWPSVSLEGGYKETETEYEFGPLDIENDTDDLYISGELVFTLFDGGLRRAEILQAKAGYRKAKDNLALQKKKIILDSENAFRDYTTAKIALLNLKDELKSSEENYKAVTMQFKYGMADSIDIMDANTLLVSAQRRILDAKYTYYLSVFSILYTRGDLIGFLLDRKG